MAGVNSLLLLLTTLAPYKESPVTYTPPSEWINDLAAQTEIIGNDDMPPCFPHIRPEGNLQCPPHEHYEQCGPVCIEACIKYPCIFKCCVEGCFCDEGYVRGYNGSCIRSEECVIRPSHFESNLIEGPRFMAPKECGPDEYISCDSHCQRNCSNHHDVIMCPKICVLDCVCILPKIRGPDGSCILPHQCPSLSQTRINLRKDAMLVCNFIRMMNPKDPRCPEQDKQCYDPNGCPYDETQNYFPRIQGNDETKRCFPDTDIEEHGTKECALNEHHERCSPACMETCFDYECPLKCCLEGCFCDEGFVRGLNGDCIPKEQCSYEPHHLLTSQQTDSYNQVTKICRQDEIVSCDSHCQRNCSNYEDYKIKCPSVCNMGCVCKPPTIRAPDGSCILPTDCPAPVLTDLEEDMRKAAMICNFARIMGNPPAWSDSCPMIVQQCIDSEDCSAPNENSFSSSQRDECPDNEEWTNCGTACPRTCDNYNAKINCIQVCRVGCFCKKPRVRGPDGKCILIQECPQRLFGQFSVCRKNEFLNILPACPVTCDNYRNKSKECKLIEHAVPRCDCLIGFVRGPHGDCIRPQECPGHEEGVECPVNEEWNDCGTACPRTCMNYDAEYRCIKVCKKGCFCKQPRVRGPDGRCLFIEECPPRLSGVCPENEEWKFCGSACPRTCTNLDPSCIQICRQGCFCKEPRVRGPDGKCVFLQQCPVNSSDRPCPQIKCRRGCFLDESHKPCPTCVCPDPTEQPCPLIRCQEDCYLDEQNKPCPKCVCTPRECPLINCIRGCYLDNNHKPCPRCVCDQQPRESQIYPELTTESNDEGNDHGVITCPENEEYKFCGSYCQNKTCSDYNKDIFCPAVCVEGCFCVGSLVRGPSGRCINVRDCPESSIDETDSY